MEYLVHRPGVKAGAPSSPPALETGGSHPELAGVWDMNAGVENLPEILDTLNAAQSRVRFAEVLAAVPPGLVSQAKSVRQWSRTIGKGLGAATGAPPAENVWAHDFLPQAQLVAQDLGLDFVVGLTGSMVAFVEHGAKHWNYFTWSDGRSVSVISCYQVREFAREAGRTFEAAVGHLIVAEILAQRNPDIVYHPEDRGCLFDFTGVRQHQVLGLRKMIVEPACLRTLAEPWRPVGNAWMKALREYEGETGG